MKITSSKDLPIGKELWLGPSHQQFCNRYLHRADGKVEVQNIYRYGKNGETVIYTEAEFDKWIEEVNKPTYFDF